MKRLTEKNEAFLGCSAEVIENLTKENKKQKEILRICKELLNPPTTEFVDDHHFIRMKEEGCFLPLSIDEYRIMKEWLLEESL